MMIDKKFVRAKAIEALKKIEGNLNFENLSVSEKLQYEQKIHDLELDLLEDHFKRYIFMIDAINDPVAIIDHRYVYLKVNKKYENIYGLPKKEIEGKKIKDLMGEEFFNSQILPYLKKCFAGESVNFQKWYHRPGSTPIFHDISYYPYFETDGSVKRIIVSCRDLTEKKLAQQKADFSRNLQQQIFKVSAPLCILDQNFKFIQVNQSFCHLFDKTDDEFLKQNCQNFWKDPITSKAENLFQFSPAGVINEQFTINIPHDSHKIICIVNAHTVYDETGSPFGIVESFTDVTQLKKTEFLLKEKNEEVSLQNEELIAQNIEYKKVQMEQQKSIEKLLETETLLDESNKRFKLLAEVSLEGILIHQNGRTVDASQRLLNMLGYSMDEIMRLNVIDLAAPRDKSIISSYASQSQTPPYRIHLVRKDGSVFPAELESRTLIQKNKSLKIVSVRDLTQRIKMEDELTLSKNKFHFYIDNAPYGFFVIDSQGYYKEVNQAFCSLTGYSEQQLLTMSIPEIIHPKSIEAGLAQQQKIARDDLTGIAIVYITKNGTERTWYETGRKLPDNSYIAFVNDITDRLIAQKKLEDQQQLLNFAISQLPIPVIIASAPDVTITHYNQPVIDLLVSDNKNPTQIELTEQRNHWPSFYPDGSPYNPEDLPLTQAIKKGITTQNKQIIIKRPDKDHWVSVSAAPLYNKDNDIIAGILAFPDITEIKDVEKSLIEREKLLNEVGDIAKVGGWEFDLPAGSPSWTKATYDIVEIAHGQPIPDINQHVDYYLAEYRQMIKNKMSDLINNGTPMSFEAELVTEKGNIKWTKAFGRREMKNDQPVRVYGTFQDITEQKNLEKTINEKNAQIRSLMDNTNDPILLADANAKTLFINEAFRNMIQNSPVLELSEPDCHLNIMDTQLMEQFQKIQDRVLNGEAVTLDYSIPFMDGSTHYMEVSFSPIIEENVVKGFSGIFRDITDRKIQEMELRLSEENYRILAEAHTNLIITHNIAGIITYINPAGSKLFNLPPSDIIGKSFDSFLSPEKQVEKENILNNYFLKNKKESFHADLPVIFPDGSSRILDLSATPIFKNDSCHSVLIVARDVTKRRADEKELARHRLELEKLVKERTDKLEKQAAELKRINKLFMGREFRIKDLKIEINQLKNILKDHHISIPGKYEI